MFLVRQLMLSLDQCGGFGLEQRVEEGGVPWAQFCSCAIVVNQLRKHNGIMNISLRTEGYYDLDISPNICLYP